MSEETSKSIANEAESTKLGSSGGPKPGTSESTRETIERLRKTALNMPGETDPPHLIFDPSHQLRSASSDDPSTPRIYFDAGRLRIGQSEDEEITLTISKEAFERLNVKTQETLSAVALAQERISKDQEEIKSLKTETRETLSRLRAA
jgi:hypothetical protein